MRANLRQLASAALTDGKGVLRLAHDPGFIVRSCSQGDVIILRWGLIAAESMNAGLRRPQRRLINELLLTKVCSIAFTLDKSLP